MPVIPHPFLFRFMIPVSTVVKKAAGSKQFLDLDKAAPLPPFTSLDQASAFARLRAGWNEDGMGFRLDVAGKRMPVSVDSPEPTEADGLQVWLDTRNTQSIHRATRYCHHFVFVPNDPNSRIPATAVQRPISLAKDNAPSNRAELLRCSSSIDKKGYVLDAWIPRESLYGFDPDSNPLIGFYYLVRDAELGEQFLSVGRDFPFDHDPSLWSTLELTR